MTAQLNVGFNQGPFTLAAHTGKFGLYAPGLNLTRIGGGGGAPSAPTALTVNIQGQATAFENSASAPTPSVPGTMGCYFTQGVPVGPATASGNVVYRSTTSATSGFTPLQNTSHFTINGLAGSGAGPITQFLDTTASNCVGSTDGHQSQPPTVYYPATTYWYRVTLVDSTGLESPMSATQQAILYKDGVANIAPSMQAYITAHGNDPSNIYNYMNMGTDFNQPPGTSGVTQNYNFSTAVPGWAKSIQLVFASFGIWLPVFSGIFSTWNYWAGAHTQLQYDIFPTAAFSSGDFTHESVMSGDVHITTSGGSNNVVNIPALTANVVNTIVWPFTTIVKDFGASPFTNFVLQVAAYKFGLQVHTGTPTIEVNNMIMPGVA